ncbi:MAG: acetyltransferase [Chloroflexota bacterium]
MKPVIIIGAGEHGAVVADVIQSEEKYELLGYVDDSANLAHQDVLGIPILGSSQALSQHMYKDVSLIVAIGNNSIRCKVATRLARDGFQFITTIHPSASVSKHAILAPGVAVMPRVVINTRSIIGAYAILNSGAIVEHDCVIGEGSHVSVGAVLAGRVEVGQRSMIGAGAVVLPHLQIGTDTTVGAGAIVTQSLPDNIVAYGIPARVNGCANILGE